MKVLLVSPIPTDPAVAGNRVRIGALFTALVRLGHDVTFGYVPYYDEPADYDKLTQRLEEATATRARKPPCRCPDSNRAPRCGAPTSLFLDRAVPW